MHLTVTPTLCDLCHRHKPSFYCSSDSAFLCCHCDSQVHAANFLVARHIRLSLCPPSSSSTSSSSSSSSSSSLRTNSEKTRNTTISDWKTRDVLINWCSRLGGGSGVIQVAKHAFEVSLVNRWVWPYRVGLAASLWLGVLRFTKEDDEHKKIRMLKRLEEISGIPAKSILAAQSKLLRMMKKHEQRQRQHQHQDEEEVMKEGWAEC